MMRVFSFATIPGIIVAGAVLMMIFLLTQCFVDAMPLSLILPITVALLAAMSCQAIKRRKHKGEVAA
jgi:hypothetical protein